MANKKGSSKHQTEEYKRYQMEGRWEKNKVRRLTRHCSANPQDKLAADALQRGNFKYTRNQFKHGKKEPGTVRLRDLPRDERTTMAVQLRGMIDRGEIIVRRN